MAIGGVGGGAGGCVGDGEHGRDLGDGDHGVMLMPVVVIAVSSWLTVDARSRLFFRDLGLSR
jgi:hypothetical protein